MTLEQLQEKRAKYSAMINELVQTDIMSKVNEKLDELRPQIEKDIKAEIAENLNKCNNYLDVIDDLIDMEQSQVSIMQESSDCNINIEQ